MDRTSWAADTKAALAGAAAAMTWITDLDPLLQVIATIVAIVAGGAAAWFHIERARALRQTRLHPRDDATPGS